jgi:PBP1b-binding outer membrane lipoprotein LpoB
MKQTIIIAFFSILAVVFTACSNGKNTENKTSTATTTDTSTIKTASVKYTCTMHPEVISDTPGKCPKCGMELVKKE